MSPYEAEMICRTVMSDRIREAERGRLAREMKAERRSTSSPATASATRRSRVWKLVHLSHAYG